MDHLNHEYDLGSEDVVRITIDHPANVMLMDAANYRLYLSGRSFRYRGGHAKGSPVFLSPPSAGHWHVVVDLGGLPGTVRAGVAIEREVVEQH